MHLSSQGVDSEANAMNRSKSATRVEKRSEVPLGRGEILRWSCGRRLFAIGI